MDYQGLHRSGSIGDDIPDQRRSNLSSGGGREFDQHFVAPPREDQVLDYGGGQSSQTFHPTASLGAASGTNGDYGFLAGVREVDDDLDTDGGGGAPARSVSSREQQNIRGPMDENPHAQVSIRSRGILSDQPRLSHAGSITDVEAA